MSKYIDTDKVIAFLNKKMESYKSKMVDPYKYPVDHIDLMALLAREYQSLILRVASFQQEQPEVDFEDIEFLLDKVKYMSGLWVKTNPNCTKIINAFNNRLNTRKEENK